MLKRVFLILLCLFFEVSICSKAFASKDFKGMFGNYQADKYTENEGNDSDFGIDISLSTMMPLSPVISSAPAGTSNYTSLYSSMFFNGEISAFLTFAYRWEFFASVGYYTYDSRVQLPISYTAPLYLSYTMTSIPVVGGVRYRFADGDIVPYVGVGAGVSWVTRQTTYDDSTLNGSATGSQNSSAVLTGEVVGGFEFFFTSHAGVRLEVSAYYLALPSVYYNPPGNASALYAANPWFLRYSSGVFILF